MSDSPATPPAPPPTGVFDPLAATPTAPPNPSTQTHKENGRTDGPATALQSQPWIEARKPSELAAYVVPEGYQMAGDFHLFRGAFSVLAGPPGCGKSRAATALAVAGATGKPWFGLPVHAKFRTLIVQCENGPVRLKTEYSDLGVPPETLDSWIRVTPPPPFGIRFDNPIFLKQLKAILADFAPGLVIFDPWNRIARDEMAADMMEAFGQLLNVLPPGYPNGEPAPATLILAHTRKPRPQERTSGRGLLNLIAGSYVLFSVPRSVFILQPASDDVEDQRVVFTVAKNNDGQLGPRSAWIRKNGLFDEVPSFDWETFDNPEHKSHKLVTEEDLHEVFEGGRLWLTRGTAAKRLMEIAEVGRTLAYDHLKSDGPFGAILTTRDDGLLGLKIAST